MKADRLAKEASSEAAEMKSEIEVVMHQAFVITPPPAPTTEEWYVGIFGPANPCLIPHCAGAARW